jgi:hypothetical protein
LYKQFIKILKRHEIIRDATQVKRFECEGKEEDGIYDQIGFDVLTTHGQRLSYRQLISIEQETGYGIGYIEPAENGHMRILFYMFPPPWRRSLSNICNCEECSDGS